MDLYKWRSLSQLNMIRLLTLEGGLREHEIRALDQYDNTTIEPAPAYEAISSTWESNETPQNLTTLEGSIRISGCV